ncbi:MAG: ATP-binding protein [Elusimicrobia bacterium]|nr:ATP-binding protein [Elusimicrobiota bacterium]
MNYIPRSKAQELRHFLRLFPVVVVSGPRQCGKTTFAQMELSQWRYLDLEKSSDYNRVQGDINFFLKEYGKHTIIDEAQSLPELFPALRSAIDQNREEKGQIVLLGSVNPILAQNISESLAGRVGFIELTPFSYSEIAKKTSLSMENVWLRGGYPEPIHWIESDFWVWMENYVKSFVTRDVLRIIKTTFSPQKQIQLLTMVAHCHGKLWNSSQIAGAFGSTYHTINQYLDVMEQFFLIRRLQPYHANIKKRLVKSSKCYFRDTGLLHFFLNIQNKEALRTSPYRGFSLEGFAIEELIRLYAKGGVGRKQFYFYRTATGEEIDLLVENGSRLDAYEIKASTSVGLKDLSGFIKALEQLKLDRGTILYLGNEEYNLNSQIKVKPLISALTSSNLRVSS